jgi:Glycosyl hydrolase family 1
MGLFSQLLAAGLINGYLVRANPAPAPAPSSAPSSASGGMSFANPSGNYSTKSFNYTAASTYLPNNDYSNEQLQLLWDQVGPISTAAISTTVEPTPEPSAFPQPGTFHPLVPDYIPEVESAQLPSNFLWGVASAAFQVEGAANAEGKGPSVW